MPALVRMAVISIRRRKVPPYRPLAGQQIHVYILLFLPVDLFATTLQLIDLVTWLLSLVAVAQWRELPLPVKFLSLVAEMSDSLL